MSEPRRVKIADEHLRSRPLHRSRKDRKRWCRGRVGVEHDWGFWEPGYGPSHPDLNRRVAEKPFWPREMWAFRVCEGCGRVDHFTHFVKLAAPISAGDAGALAVRTFGTALDKLADS